ncbi:hypothetical protein C4J81_04850 [Deltaproteobacteria bacterium Smac51]|nr:hypothetical protein C4J81_04850 [Deltaproteobacteria bacterium Smac51]
MGEYWCSPPSPEQTFKKMFSCRVKRNLFIIERTILMFSKTLIIAAAAFCLFSAPMAMAQYSRPAYSDSGICYRGLNGTGEVIHWAKTESQCQFNGASGSWVEAGEVKNFHHGK